MGSNKYRTNPTATQIVDSLRERIREIALQLRTTLTVIGLTTNGPLTVSGSLIRSAAVLTPDGSFNVTIEADSTSFAYIPLTYNCAGSTITDATQYEMLTVTWAQDDAGGRTYVWPTNCKFAGAAPSNTTANTKTSVTFMYDGTNWFEINRAVGVG